MTQHSHIDLNDVPTCEQAYRQTIRSVQRLDQEQERSLVERARTGGKEERDNLLLYLFSSMDAFARHLALSWTSHRPEYEDLAQQGCLEIASHIDQALREVDHVIPYLLKAGYGAIRNEAWRASHPIAAPTDVEPLRVLSLDAPLTEDEDYTLLDLLGGDTFSVVIETTSQHEALHSAIRALSERERTLVVRHFGLYINAPEPVSEILRSLGVPKANVTHVMGAILSRLCLMLKDVYPQYCSPTREVRSTTPSHLTHRPFTQEQEQRLQEAEARMIAQNIPITGKKLAREARIDRGVATRYVNHKRSQQAEQTQEERLDRAMKELQERGEPLTAERLRQEAHVHHSVACLYLHMHSHHVSSRPRSDRPVEERLQEAYARLSSQGEPLTMRRLRQEAHVDNSSACAFLQRMREPQLVSA